MRDYDCLDTFSVTRNSFTNRTEVYNDFNEYMGEVDARIPIGDYTGEELERRESELANKEVSEPISSSQDSWGDDGYSSGGDDALGAFECVLLLIYYSPYVLGICWILRVLSS